MTSGGSRNSDKREIKTDTTFGKNKEIQKGNELEEKDVKLTHGTLFARIQRSLVLFFGRVEKARTSKVVEKSRKHLLLISSTFNE